MPFVLDAVFAALGIDPLAEGVQIVPASLIRPPEPFAPLLPFVTTRPLLICGLDDHDTVQRVRIALLAAYPSDHVVKIASCGRVETLTVASLGCLMPAHECCAYLPAQDVLKAVRSFDALRQITARLRAPGGCPWDREQTHQSLKPYVLEETYEVLEALDSDDRLELCEELGDLLMQVMIHAQIAAERGEFDLGDVLAGISGKLVRRHPHVFADVQVNGAQDVLRNWQSIKRAEKEANGAVESPSLLGSVPRTLPALAYAQAILERAARFGFHRPTEAVFDEVVEAVRRVQSSEDRLAAYGDVLLALVQVGRWLDMEAEEALRLASRRYRRRFEAVEELCRQKGMDIAQLDAEQRAVLGTEAV